VELVEPEHAWSAVESVFERFHSTVPGSVARPHFYRPMLTGTYNFKHQAPDTQLRAAVHLDASGTPDGYALYRHAGRDQEPRAVDVSDLVATTPAAYLRLWRFLADIDLVQRVRFGNAPIDDPLEWALVDPHALKVTGVRDFLWVRVLDVPVALQARVWSGDGSVVLGVDDPTGHASGSWQVHTEHGRASVTRTDAEPDVRMAADTLGSLYLGGATVAAQRRAGRLAGRDDAIDGLAAMADGGPTPYCVTGF
jgi:predicted acetyltransferase